MATNIGISRSEQQLRLLRLTYDAKLNYMGTLRAGYGLVLRSLSTKMFHALLIDIKKQQMA